MYVYHRMHAGSSQSCAWVKAEAPGNVEEAMKVIDLA